MADQATESELRELFSMDDDDGPLPDKIDVCSGCWVRSGGWWFFHSNDEE